MRGGTAGVRGIGGKMGEAGDDEEVGVRIVCHAPLLTCMYQYFDTHAHFLFCIKLTKPEINKITIMV